MISSQYPHVVVSAHEPSNPFALYAGAFRKYAVFKGRASRAEYWSMFFINLALGAVLYGLAVGGAGEVFLLLYVLLVLVTFLPGLSVLVRRLHDTGRSGWHFWWCAIRSFVCGLRRSYPWRSTAVNRGFAPRVDSVIALRQQWLPVVSAVYSLSAHDCLSPRWS
jgi:uncharacterized membrane protein YhaH (DUF805 family)